VIITKKNVLRPFPHKTTHLFCSLHITYLFHLMQMEGWLT